MGNIITKGTLLGLASTGKWTRIAVPGPTILLPTYGTVVAISSVTFIPRLRYAFSRIPPDSAGAVPPIDDVSEYSVNGGVCFLSEEGEWWVHNPNPGGLPIPYLLIDAPLESIQNRYLGPRLGNQFGVQGSGPVLGVGGVLLNANALRAAVTIENITAATNLWVGTGFTPGTDAAPNGGYKILPGGVLTLDGDLLYCGVITLRSGSGADVANAHSTIELIL